jgi:hypothetical protein
LLFRGHGDGALAEGDGASGRSLGADDL